MNSIPLAAATILALSICLSASAQTAQTASSNAGSPPVAKKFTPSAKAKADYANCIKMPDLGEASSRDCGNFLRPDMPSAAKAPKATAAKSKPEPNYFGEGCESGCYLPKS